MRRMAPMDTVPPQPGCTVSQRTTERLRQLILSGQFSAGAPLRQDQLCAALGVSRTPLRQAIIALEAEGLIVSTPHRGAVVYKPTATELREIYDLRILLETRAARAAAARIDDATILEIERITQEMAENVSPAQLVALNDDFRLRLYAHAGNRLMLEMIGGLTRRARPYVLLLVVAPHRPFTRREFAPLLQALRARNGGRAAEITRRHLEKTVSRLLPMLGGTGTP